MICELLLKHRTVQGAGCCNKFLFRTSYRWMRPRRVSFLTFRLPDTSLVGMRGSTLDLNGLDVIKIANNAKLSRSGCSVINNRVISKESNAYLNNMMLHFKLLGKYSEKKFKFPKSKPWNQWLDNLSIHLCCC